MVVGTVQTMVSGVRVEVERPARSHDKEGEMTVEPGPGPNRGDGRRGRMKENCLLQNGSSLALDGVQIGEEKVRRSLGCPAGGLIREEGVLPTEGAARGQRGRAQFGV